MIEELVALSPPAWCVSYYMHYEKNYFIKNDIKMVWYKDLNSGKIEILGINKSKKYKTITSINNINNGQDIIDSSFIYSGNINVVLCKLGIPL